jgi:hypothetical protein
MGLHVISDTTGTGIKMVLKRNIPPQIGEDVVLRSIKGIRAGHLRPFPTDNLPVTILYLIEIGKRGYGMLVGRKGCCLQGPVGAIVGDHQQITALDSTVSTDEMNDHMKVFPPLGTILYRES